MISNINSAKQITYKSVIGPGPDGEIEKSNPITSDVFNYFFTSASIGCNKHKDTKSC